MRKYLLTGLLLIGLLLLGCTGGGEAVSNSSGSEGERASEGTGNGGTGGLDLKGMGYAQLVALGVPVECTVVQSENGVTTNFTLKIKGDNVRGVGTTTENGATANTEFIISGDTVYIKIPPEQAGSMGACQWIKVVSNQSAGEQAGEIDVTPKAVLESPTAQYSCMPGAFSDEVFSPPAVGVCDLNAIISGMGAANGGPMPDPCDQVTDDTRKQLCKNACGGIVDEIQKVQCAANYMTMD